MEIEESRKKYLELLPKYKKYTVELKNLLETLLASVNYHLIECRTKDIDSFCEKIKRKTGKYTDPLNEITDLIGLRVILYYKDDVEKVEGIIKENFFIHEIKKEEPKANTFGYSSTHLIVIHNEFRSNLPEWIEYKDIKVEIQVRTVLQHAWAAISHELEYKKEIDIPLNMRRPLYRMAGLIELADEEFERIRNDRKELLKAITERKEINEVKVYDEINLDTLKNYFKNPNETIQNLVVKAKIKDLTYAYIDLKDFKNLLLFTELLKIKTINELDSLIKDKLSTLKLDISRKPQGPYLIATQILVEAILAKVLLNNGYQISSANFLISMVEC